jgi:hypothetical protein
MAQNDTCHKISRCFRTTPTDPLHALLGIPPITYTVASLCTCHIVCLEHLLPTSPLLTILTHNPFHVGAHLTTHPHSLAYWLSLETPMPHHFIFLLPFTTLPGSVAVSPVLHRCNSHTDSICHQLTLHWKNEFTPVQLVS